MTKNVGGIDKIVRVVLGLALIAYGVMTGSWLGAIGLVPLATAAMGFCPAYLPLGMSTCPRE